MRKIAAMAVLTVRAAIRSRIITVAAAALAAAIIGLPFIIRGDGTPESQAGIFINYSFGLLMTVLALTATWCGAGAISLEAGNRQIQILITKPLRAVQIWIGKLLGLMMINFFLLALGGALICALLHWTIRPARTGPAGQDDLHGKIMTVYRTVSPLKVSGLQGGPAAIGPGQRYRWRFDLTHQPAAVKSSRANNKIPGRPPVLLKFKFVPSPFSHQSPVTGTWRAFTGKNPDLFSKTIATSPHMPAYLNMPGLDTPGLVELEYLNLQTNPAVTVFIPSENDLGLLIPASSFEANLLRGLIIAFARLAFFTSLGMIAGVLFSFPVAVFASMGLLTIVFSGGLVRQLAERGLWAGASPDHLFPMAVILNDIVRGSFRFFAAILSPLDRFDPLAFLPDSLFIPWSLAGQSLLVLCGLYPLILMLIGAGCLSRREVGLSSQ